MFKEDIPSITLGELMLILLFVVLALFYVTPDQSDDSGELYAALEEKNEQIEELKRSLEDHKEKASEYKKILARRELRSKQIPTCKEIGKSDSFIATVSIKGPNSFQVQGNIYTFDELQAYLHTDIEVAHQFDCRQCVKVKMAEDLSLRDFDAAKSKLEKLFYTKRVGFK